MIFDTPGIYVISAEFPRWLSYLSEPLLQQDLIPQGAYSRKLRLASEISHLLTHGLTTNFPERHTQLNNSDRSSFEVRPHVLRNSLLWCLSLPPLVVAPNGQGPESHLVLLCFRSHPLPHVEGLSPPHSPPMSLTGSSLSSS